jgi:hypothetical protein
MGHITAALQHHEYVEGAAAGLSQEELYLAGTALEFVCHHPVEVVEFMLGLLKCIHSHAHQGTRDPIY